MSDDAGNDTTRVPRPRRRLRRAELEALSPLWATLALLVVYILSIVFLINFCQHLGTCSEPNVGQFMQAHGFCTFGGRWDEPLSVERAGLWADRLLWVFISAINVLACLTAVFISLRLVSRYVRRTALAGTRVGKFLKGRRVWAVPLGLFLISMVPLAMGQEHKFLPQVYDILNCAPAQDLHGAPLLGYFIICISLLPLACLVLASCVIVWPPRTERKQRPAELARRIDALRLLLYTGTAALVTTVLRVSMTFRWGLSHLPSGENVETGTAAAVKVLQNFTSAFVSTQSASYTLFLAAVYVPALLVLSRRAEVLAGVRRPAPEREEWLKTRGLAASLSEHLPRIVAILGPFLAGPLGDLIGFLTK